MTPSTFHVLIGRKWAIAFLATITLMSFSAPCLRAETPPNIIFLLTDDQRDNTLGAMGHPFVKTPQLDALMRDSVRFRNAYIATPVCSPSRVSYLTGMPERVHGVGFSSSYDLTEEQWKRTYPALLRSKGGYHTGFIGKFGVEYYTFKGHAAEKFDYWWGHDGWTKFLPKDHNQPSTEPYHRAKGDIITPIMGDAMAEFLDSAPAGKPFCLSVSFNVPHGSQTTSMYSDYPEWHQMTRPANENPKLRDSPYYDTLYRDISIPLPPDTGTDPYRLIPKFILDQDKGRTNTYAYNYQIDTCREHHIRYYQTISGLDHVIGELREDLKRRGLAENTVILFGSDHGLIMGEYGMGGKELLLDLSAKIPCIVHDPRVPEDLRGRQLDHLVSSIDFTRTILDYAGVEAPEFMEGRSLRPLVEGRETEWRDELFLESLFTMRDNPFQEGIRTRRWKYIRMYDGIMPYKDEHVDFADRPAEFELLFDLEADPGEQTNLATDAAHADILAELREKTATESIAIHARREAFKAAVPTTDRVAKPRPAKKGKK